MAFTKKIAGWAAGRLKGEKARKDTMRWMEKTGLGKVLDVAGDVALASGAAKGIGGLKTLLGGGAAAPGTAPVLKEMPKIGQSITTIGARPEMAITPPGLGGGLAGAKSPGMMSRLLGGARQGAGDLLAGAQAGAQGALRFARENAPLVQAGFGAASDVLGQQAERAIEEQKLAQQQQQFEKGFNVSEEERRRQREQANRLAGLFMPRSA